MADPAYQAAVAQWEALNAQREALRVAREAIRVANNAYNSCLHYYGPPSQWPARCSGVEVALDAARAAFAAARAALKEHDAGTSHPCHTLPLGCN